MLKIYNTLTKRKEEFIPKSDEVKIYTCGVTVYDDCHIGHGRSLYIFEIMRRYFKHLGFKVKFVRNITDVDDKIINKAREVSLQSHISIIEAFEKVRKKYIDSYYKDLEILSIPSADIEPLATENIPYMIEFISGLINKGFAYQREGNVYFSVRKFPFYGKLSGKKIDNLLSGVRIDEDPLKKDALDFALWKRAKLNEPYWDSPWGKGRPGWHIECSVMSQRYLDTETLDIHGGGLDLIFPHHENEIAQSEAFSGKPFSSYWIHHGLLTINSEKMAKSLGNFITIKDAVKKYSSLTLKLFYLTAHYRSPLDFNETKLSEVMSIKRRIKVALYQLRYFKDIYVKDFSYDNIKAIYKKFIDSMDDDFNMPLAFSSLFELMGEINTKSIKEERFFEEAKALLKLILDIFLLPSEVTIGDGVIGLKNSLGKIEEWEREINIKEIEEKIFQRKNLRMNKR
ncbi:MAG: cysteine--tRNA ligase, partial [Candidatus Omnitrophica bacterium]|nr:cysteine--tRNA ligase [Candidatus Omnitrophota bacterium]